MICSMCLITGMNTRTWYLSILRHNRTIWACKNFAFSMHWLETSTNMSYLNTELLLKRPLQKILSSTAPRLYLYTSERNRQFSINVVQWILQRYFVKHHQNQEECTGENCIWILDNVDFHVWLPGSWLAQTRENGWGWGLWKLEPLMALWNLLVPLMADFFPMPPKLSGNGGSCGHTWAPR